MGRSPSAAHIGSAKDKEDEPKQLAQWAEHLHQELLDLTQERDGLLGQLADAQTATKKMQMELESLRRRSAQFERVICGDQVPMDVIGENGDLRSQLKAYEAEVEELRAERGRLQTCHTRSQQIVQQLHKEREELRAQHRQILDEHEHSKANCSRLQSLHGSERLQRQRLESQLHSQSGEKEIAAATRHEGLQKEHLKAWEELQRVHGLAKDKDAKLELAMKLAQEAIGMATELQDAFVQQTKKYHELSRSVRKHQGQLLQDMKEAQELPRLAEDFALELQQLLGSAREANSIGEEQWKKEARKLEDQVQNLTMQHREVAKTVREFRQADDDRKAKDLEQLSKEDDRRKLKMQRDGRLSNPNIIKQMAQATDGLEISKVDERNRMEKLRLRVLCDVSDRGGPRPDLQLQWSKAPYKDWRSRSSCDLSQVVSIGYGFASRAAWLFAVPAHRCFSVCTPVRSFDFVCNTDNDVEAFVLVISRLCTRSQGWPVYGGVHSHARFVAMKGWTKVQAACRANKNTLSTHLLEAVSKMPRQLPPPPAETEMDPDGGAEA